MFEKIKEWVEEVRILKRIKRTQQQYSELSEIIGDYHKINNNIFNKIFEDIEYLKIKTMNKVERQKWLKECLKTHNNFIKFAKESHKTNFKLEQNLGNEAIFKVNNLRMKIKTIPTNFDRWRHYIEKITGKKRR